MTVKARAIFAFTLIAVTGNAATRASEPHNLVLFIPEALPAIIEQGNAPTLHRLREQGVHFTNSHSGFPRIRGDDLTDVAPDLHVLSLMDAASQKYATAFVYDERVTGDAVVGAQLQKFLETRLPDITQGGRPFLFIYRLIEARTSGDLRRAYKSDPRAADAALEAIEKKLAELDLTGSTNIVVTGEHGLSRVMKLSHTSAARRTLPGQDTLGTLPPGFVAIDLLAAFQTDDSLYQLFDSDNSDALVHLPTNEHPKQGNAIIAADYEPSNPFLTVEAHGVYDSIFVADSLSRGERRSTAKRIVEAMLEQDYVGAILVNEARVGRIRGGVPLSQIAGKGGDDPRPDVLVAFASISEGCLQPVTCMTVIADTPLAEGDGIPNNFSRAGTSVFMAARGPDFQDKFIDRAPASNADIARTVGELLDVEFEIAEGAKGRVLMESLAGDRSKPVPQARKYPVDSDAAEDGSITRLTLQSLGSAIYFDAALSSNQERMALAETGRRFRWHWPFKTFTITISDDKY